MKDTRNRHYIKRPSYAPASLEKDGKTYYFVTAYIEKETGLEIVYKTADGWNWHFYMGYHVGPYIMEKYGVTIRDILRTEAENGYTEHIEIALERLRYAYAESGAKEKTIEENTAYLRGLLKIAKKAGDVSGD